MFLEPSPIGLKTNVGDFSEGLELRLNGIQNKIDETYELPNIKQNKVHYIANEAVFSFTKNKDPANKWYVAGINAQKETIKIKLKLPMIAGNSVLKQYTDDFQLKGSISTKKLKKIKKLK